MGHMNQGHGGGDGSDESSMPEFLTIKIVSIFRAALVPVLKYR